MNMNDQPTRTVRWWWPEGQRDVMMDLFLPADLSDEARDEFDELLGIRSGFHSVDFLRESLSEFGQRWGFAMAFQMSQDDDWRIIFTPRE
jgi:hypothetical protein